MPDPFREHDTGAGALPTAANPFTPGPGKVPPAFGGRYDPLVTAKAIVDKLAVPTDPVRMPLLRGVRGVGKTALMAYTRHHAARTGTITLHIEADPGDHDLAAACQSLVRDASGLVGVAEDLARRLTAISLTRGEMRFAPAPDGRADVNIESLLYDLVLLADRKNVGLLLTVDEVHEAEELLLRPLMRAIHRHAQDARALGLMLSGLPGAARTLLEEGQTYAERLATYDLGMLRPDGVAEALRQPFEDDAGVGVDDAAVDHVAADTGGYPYFVQLWGEALWDTLPERRGIRLSDTARAQPRVDATRGEFFASRWRRLPDGRARELVRALATADGRGRVSALARALGLPSSNALGPARDQLISQGQLYSPERGILEFTVPGFAPWIREHGDADR
jgi:hypothetical protein